MVQQASNLENRITAQFDSLSPKQRAIARLILDNRYFASFASAAEIGERVDASAATVVRLCQVLGYEGLPDLQESIREDLPSYLTAVERLERRSILPSINEELPQRVFANDLANLRHTATVLASPDFDRAVDLLTTSNQVLVIGSGVSGPPAQFLAYSLEVMGRSARAIVDGGLGLAVALARLTPEDVVVGISFWRYTQATVHALQQARTHGVHTIAITDSIVSPIAREVDVAFEVATDGVAHSLSITALVSLLNAFVAGVALQQPEETSLALREVDSQFKALDLLTL